MAILWQAYLVTRVVMGVAAMLVNLLTLCCVAVYKFLRTPANMLVAGIALTDFLHGILTGIIMFARYQSSSWQDTHALCLVGLCIETTTVYCQVVSFCMLALERRNSLLFQLNKSKKWSFKVIIIIILSMWTTIATVNIVVTILSTDVPEGTACSVLNYFPVYYKYVATAVFFIACLIIPVAYGSIAWIAHKSSLQVAAAAPTALENRKNDMKITKMMGLVVGVFYALYLPFFIITNTVTPTSPKWHLALWYVSILIYDINFWINPFIYAWRDKGFKKAFRRIIASCRVVCGCPAVPEVIAPPVGQGALQIAGEQIQHPEPTGSAVKREGPSAGPSLEPTRSTRLVPREP